MGESKSRIKQLKGALLLIGILVLGSVVTLFVMHQQKATPGQSGGIAVIKQKSTISLKGVHHTAIKNGVKEWSLNAESADYRLEDSEAVFRTLHVTFFNEAGGGTFLSADSGSWNTESNDLDVTGRVMLKNRQYVLQTEKLTYIHEKRMCVAEVPVTATSEAIKITADNMRYDLGGNLIYLDGNVAGIIDEDIGL